MSDIKEKIILEISKKGMSLGFKAGYIAGCVDAVKLGTGKSISVEDLLKRSKELQVIALEEFEKNLEFADTIAKNIVNKKGNKES